MRELCWSSALHAVAYGHRMSLPRLGLSVTPRARSVSSSSPKPESIFGGAALDSKSCGTSP
eukprot:4474714-Alexandrium_andersonii.AAC.1